MNFTEWYADKHGYEPFPWQVRLALEVSAGKWPDEITLPTGTGKTSVIDIWAWAHESRVPGVPTRLCYVIDRRLVVDSVTAHAEALGVNVVKMRGGMTPDDSWLMDPVTPTVIVSTVDQIGSRLLWRGYGVSPKVAPIHAGLVGNDALIVLDEAHISTPFAATLDAVAQHRTSALDLPWRTILMTATPTNERGSFGLDADDLAHPVLKPRLEAKRLTKLDSAKPEVFTRVMAQHAKALRESGAQVVMVVCNTVAGARDVFARLNGDKVLLTGRVRPSDKDQIIAEYLPRIESGSRARGRDPLYLVSTQTIEVGADIDCDAMVTEWAPIDALRQRIGRVDRLGELGTTTSVIVRKIAPKDWVYGIKVLRDTWKWITGMATGTGKAKVVDWGLLAMAATVEGNPPPVRPLPATKPLLPTDVRRLRQTWPVVKVDVSPWLHGLDNDQGGVQVAWRADLGNDVTVWPDVVSMSWPVVAELMPCPVGEVSRWLGDRPAVVNGKVVTGQEIQPGDVIVVPAGYGGYDSWGWAPHDRAAVPDVGNVVERRRTRVRLHPDLYPDHAKEIRELANGGDVKVVLSAIGIDILRPVAAPYPGGVIVTDAPVRVDGRAVHLSDHLIGVSGTADRITPATMSGDVRTEVITAARQHDIGKSDPRFQTLLGGHAVALAKSAHHGPVEAAQARHWSGLPSGWRHEVASVALLPDSASDLLRYLIGTHHGHARQVLPISGGRDLWQRAGGPNWGNMTRALNVKYGPWALAYLESLVRLSDWIRSAEEQLA